jgi:hypothetical protein
MSDAIKKPRQFRLITLIGVMTLAAVGIRLFVAFPSQVISVLMLAATAPAMLWLVSAISESISALWRLAIRGINATSSCDKDRSLPPWHARLWIALRYGDPTIPYPMPPAWIVALVTTTLTVLLWHPIWRVGNFFCGIPIFYSTESFANYVANSWSWSLWTDAAVWKLILLWEAGSLTHWWLHFAILGIFGMSVVGIRGGDWNLKERLRRFLWFAPWLMLLELMLLVASWILEPMTVAEPATGFVVGIFHWELWHWDCWQNQFWLQRASFPCVLVTAVFCRRLFGLSWQLATLTGVFSIPIAIMGCIAWTVLFGDVMEWLGW